MQRRWNGKRRKPRRRTATGVKNCRSFIAGPTTTACLAQNGILCRRTSRRRIRSRSSSRERHCVVHGWSSADCRMVAFPTTADSQTLAGGRSASVTFLAEHIVAAGCKGRVGRISRGGRLAVRAAHQRLLDADGFDRLAAAACAKIALVQHRRAGGQQHRAAMGGLRPRGIIDDMADHGPAWRRCFRRCFSDRPVFGVAAIGCCGLCPDRNPANAFFYLITAIHGLHCSGRSCCVGPDRLPRLGAVRHAAAASERRTVRDVLAFPVAGLADFTCAVDRLDGRFHQHLSSPSAHRKETRWRRLC